MNELAKLTKRETEIAELFAWGAAKKDVANRLFISERTVENHTRNIYSKIGCGKVNELSAWWFCTRFDISFDLSPLKRQLTAFCMLLILIPETIFADNIVRTFRTKNIARVCRVVRRRADNDGECNTFRFKLDN